MKFNLLGPFEIITEDGRSYTPPTPKVCQVLALLLTRPKEIVPVDSFIEELWGDNPPRSSLTTLQTYIYHARKTLVTEALAGPEEKILLTRNPGYLIDLTGHRLDTREFEEMVKSGRRAADQGSLEAAARILGDALDMWSGPALANISTGRLLAGQRTYLEELRVRAVERRIETLKLLGNERDLIPELRALVQQYPLNEWFHAQLIESLSTCGRRAEALKAYRDLWRSLADELGIEPSPEVQRLHHEVLNPVTRSGRAA
ncbi:AfsR/SARP family transcriptional regulator [Streptomyces sp. DSM 3412]|uniref:AfsR/SARP family transcriptional regulator n=1 Tax=Streptomyces gottesmaniae TaxID=3075518 RepID=A0ABU2YRM4_9ACTN|nr:AfsR/SARP family transcriptional regulator [Streptomyces sp. DSM 3412]MDT0566730.1 AfsR/SARP family transcriptional regulator [Streptomyces sp. DSM 3412]